MDRDELLKCFEGKISNYYYDILKVWTKKREKKFCFFKRKFDVSPTIMGYGYVIHASSVGDSIIVYKE